MDLLGRVGDDAVLEPPNDEAHAGAGDELYGRLELRLVPLCIRELGPEVLSDQVRDALSEDAGHQVGSSLPRQGLPEASVSPDVLKDDEHGLQELDLASRPLLRRVPLGGYRRADVLEPRAEKIVLVAVVRVEGRSSDIRMIEDVLDRDAVVPLLLDKGEEGSPEQLTRSPHPPVRRCRAHGLPPSRTTDPVTFGSERIRAIGC